MGFFDFGGDIERLVLIGAIAMLVLGPERFPRVAREAGKWYRTVRQYIDAIMAEIRGAYEELETEVEATTEEGTQAVRELRGESTTDGNTTATERASGSANPGTGR